MNSLVLTCGIYDTNIKKSLQVLIDNGIDKDEAGTVLQALGYTLLNVELEKQFKDLLFPSK